MVIRFRLGNEMREELYWKGEKKRRMYSEEEETMSMCGKSVRRKIEDRES